MGILLWLICVIFNGVTLSNMTKKGIISDSILIAFWYAVNLFTVPLMSVILLIIVYLDWKNALIK